MSTPPQVALESFALKDVPERVSRFWHDTRASQDPVGVLSSSHEWLDLLTSHDSATAVIASVESQLALPMMRRPYTIATRLMGRSLRQKSFDVFKVCGGELISSGVDAPGLAAVWDALFEQHPQVDAIWFDHIASPERLALIEQSSGLSDCSQFHLLEAGLPHYRAVLPDEVEACMAMRSSKSRSRLRSKARALGRELGADLAVREFRTPEEWAPYAERIDALMAQSWQVRMLGHAFSLAHHHTAATRGMVRAFLLTCGEDAVAFTLYYSGRDTLIAGFLGYDQRFARHSPGSVLFLKTLECLYAHDTPRYLDFGEGDADYKQQWSNDTIEVTSLMLLRKGARLDREFKNAARCEALTETTRAALRRLGLERKLLRKMKRQA